MAWRVSIQKKLSNLSSRGTEEFSISMGAQYKGYDQFAQMLIFLLLQHLLDWFWVVGMRWKVHVIKSLRLQNYIVDLLRLELV